MKWGKTGRFLAACLATCMIFSTVGVFAYAQDGDVNGNEMEPETAGTINGQPNYIYRALGESTDSLFSQQWGLYNDGSFQMEEKANPFPVFDDPFEQPWGRDQWRLSPGIAFPWSTGGTNRGSASGVKSTAGIDINVKEAWDLFNTNGSEVIVAVIDTGVDYTSDQLKDAMWVNDGEIPGDGIDNDGNGYVDDVYGWNFYDGNNQVFTGEEDNHGTHGAGTIAAKRDDQGTAGIAGSSQVRIMALKALGGEDGSGTTESIIQAIQYAEENGANICNLSLGTTGDDQLLKEAIANSDMLFVAAAGNGSDWTGAGRNTDRYPTYPAAWNLDNLISVANLQPDGTLHYSSNYGQSTIDIAAPGSYILSTLTGGEYGYMTGTSMAAPMVTGVAAMLYSQYGDLTAQEAKAIVLSSAKPLDSLQGKVRTGGMLDAGAALSLSREEAAQSVWSQDTEIDVGEGSGAEDGGRAPVIRAYASMDLGFRRYLVVNVTDPDGDLELVRYAEGIRQAAWFQRGNQGTAFSLDEEGNGKFTYARGGVYTFYAVDRSGNETVSIVSLSGAPGLSEDFSGLFRRMIRW